MRVFHFTETEYPHLPNEDEYETTRTILPNRIYDPELGAKIYHECIDEWIVADEEGLDIMVNEHHQTPTCLVPSGPLLLGILARVTKKARLLLLGNPAANRRQPVRIAEEMAMVDVLSRGRVNCGIVKGVPYEVAAVNSSPVRMNERMWEAHDLILEAWTRHDGPFSFEGRFFHHRTVNIWPRPYQDPHPPMWGAASSPFGAVAFGEKGYTLGTFLAGRDRTPKIFEGYRQGWRRAGHAGAPPLDRFAYCGLVFTGETDEEGRRGAEKLLWYLRQYKVPQYLRNPPGYAHVNANVMMMRTGKTDREKREPDLDELIDKGIVFCGSPDTVYEQLKSFYDDVGGFGNFLAMGRSGFIGHDAVVKSIRLFARKVHPRLKELTANRQVA